MQPLNPLTGSTKLRTEKVQKTPSLNRVNSYETIQTSSSTHSIQDRLSVQAHKETPLKQKSQLTLQSSSVLNLTERLDQKLSDSEKKIESLKTLNRENSQEIDSKPNVIARDEGKSVTFEKAPKVENLAAPNIETPPPLFVDQSIAEIQTDSLKLPEVPAERLSLGEFIQSLNQNQSNSSPPEEETRPDNPSPPSNDFFNSQTQVSLQSEKLQELETQIEYSANKLTQKIDELSLTNPQEDPEGAEATSRLLSSTLSEIRQTRDQLNQIRATTQNAVQSFEQKTPEFNQPAIAIHEAQELVQSVLQGDPPGDQMVRAQERMTPDAVSQLLL